MFRELADLVLFKLAAAKLKHKAPTKAIATLLHFILAGRFEWFLRIPIVLVSCRAKRPTWSVVGAFVEHRVRSNHGFQPGRRRPAALECQAGPSCQGKWHVVTEHC